MYALEQQLLVNSAALHRTERVVESIAMGKLDHISTSELSLVEEGS
jgi:hypothetical protein